MKRILLQPAYVLHRRPYRETSFIVELWTENEGRIAAIARGVRKSRSATAGLLQPFTPLLVSWVGKDELMTLTHIEARGEKIGLQGDCVFAGFYLNELLMRLLQKGDPHPALYMAYVKTIMALQLDVLDEKILRSFEKYLLTELGYGLLPKTDFSLHNTFLPDKYYRFVAEEGLVLCEWLNQAEKSHNIFSGKSLLAYANEDWQDEVSLQDAKRLTRFLLAPLLGPRPIYSRRLFMLPEERSHHEEETHFVGSKY